MTDVLDRLEMLEPRFTRPVAPPPRRVRFAPSPAMLRVAASLSVAAGVIHLVMVPSHAGESTAEGVSFALAGWFQLLTAWLLLNRSSRALLAPIAFANTVFIGAWVWSRTAGLPIGAHAGVSEPAGFVDGTTVGFEVALLLACAVLALGSRARPKSPARGMRVGLVIVVGVVALASAAIASPSARDHAGHGAVDDKGLGALSNGHHHAIGPEAPLDAATRAELTRQIALTQQAAAMYPTVAAAEAAGYRRAGPYSPGLGTHYIRASGEGLNADGAMDDADLLNPLALIYAGSNPDSPIAGFMYYSMSKDQPAGFAGPNDQWHYHLNTCIKYNADGTIDAPFGADTDVPASLCTQAGGHVLEQTQWMVHVWSVPGWESQQGLFGEVNPALACPDGTYHQLPLDQWVNHPLNVCRT
jgi:hypothetical protein